MYIKLKRLYKKERYTIGKLYINGDYICDTLEDKDRGLSDKMSEAEIKQRKVYGMTAIPVGKYQIALQAYSPKYGNQAFYRDLCGGYVPRLVGVKGFEGILIHAGNSSKDTYGCILVGRNKAVGQVLDSRTTFKSLYIAHLKPCIAKHEEVWIEIC